MGFYLKENICILLTSSLHFEQKRYSCNQCYRYAPKSLNLLQQKHEEKKTKKNNFLKKMQFEEAFSYPKYKDPKKNEEDRPIMEENCHLLLGPNQALTDVEPAKPGVQFILSYSRIT